VVQGAGRVTDPVQKIAADREPAMIGNAAVPHGGRELDGYAILIYLKCS
jgi:hypothetical protein